MKMIQTQFLQRKKWKENKNLVNKKNKKKINSIEKNRNKKIYIKKFYFSNIQIKTKINTFVTTTPPPKGIYQRVW